MKIITHTLLFLLLSVVSLPAQSDFEKWKEQQKKDFQEFAEQQTKEFQAFRDKVNAEFAEFISRPWDEFRTSQAITAPRLPEPVKPPVAEPDKKPTSDPLPFDKVLPAPAPRQYPQPIAPIPFITTPDRSPERPVQLDFSFSFYNTECKVTLNNTLRFSLPDASEQSITQGWKILSGNQYDALINDCLTLRRELNLGDWGYMLLLRTMSEKFFGKASNEAVLLQMFILTQSGYKVRIARTNNRLALLIPSRQTIYQYNFLNVDGVKYYIINKDLYGQSFYICNREFPKEQYFTWQTEQPKLTKKPTAPKTFVSTRYPQITATIQTNQNLMDFYNNYPLSSHWDLYAYTGLSETVKQTLYPVLQEAIAGKSKAEAADMLLNFLQTTFDYQVDEVQFGYERPFFADENFYYPYNNCKDRAILYSVLIKDLLDLEVVLLYYPNHLATAVHFRENINGDYLTIDGKKFIVCDPTYIGASIGMAMDECRRVKAEVIRLQ